MKFRYYSCTALWSISLFHCQVPPPPSSPSPSIPLSSTSLHPPLQPSPPLVPPAYPSLLLPSPLFWTPYTLPLVTSSTHSPLFPSPLSTPPPLPLSLVPHLYLLPPLYPLSSFCGPPPSPTLYLFFPYPLLPFPPSPLSTPLTLPLFSSLSPPLPFPLPFFSPSTSLQYLYPSSAYHAYLSFSFQSFVISLFVILLS